MPYLADSLPYIRKVRVPPPALHLITNHFLVGDFFVLILLNIDYYHFFSNFFHYLLLFSNNANERNFWFFAVYFWFSKAVF